MKKTNLQKIFYFPIFTCVLALFYFAGSAEAVPAGSKLTFEGQGAGEVIFDGTVHAAKGLTCADCHESRGLMPPIFEMKKNADFISMRKMEMGLSCGKCHYVSMADTSHCSECHHK